MSKLAEKFRRSTLVVEVADALEARVFADAPGDQADHKHGDQHTERADNGRPDAAAAKTVERPDETAESATPGANALPFARFAALAGLRNHAEHEAASEGEADRRCDNQSKSDNRLANGAENRDENVHVVSPDLEFREERRVGGQSMLPCLRAGKPAQEREREREEQA
ncbi:hypothetical protein BH11CYA1_BH11CYA1_38750 [soil metagenome]